MVVIVLAAVGAGAINSLVGSGTLITFPTLVALGFPPVTATMSNAIGLVAGGVSGTWGYRAELKGQWHRLRWQIPASVGGAAIGAFLLLHLPEKVFTRIVPVLLVLALCLVIAGPRIQAFARARSLAAGRAADHVSPGRMAALVLGTFAVGIYGGFIQAGVGFFLSWALVVAAGMDLVSGNAVKTIIIGCYTTISLVIFFMNGLVNIPVGLVLAVGSMAGAVLGARFTVMKGNRWVRYVLALVVVVSAVKMVMDTMS